MGGLSWDTDDDSLRRAFESYGEIVEGKFARLVEPCFVVSLA